MPLDMAGSSDLDHLDSVMQPWDLMSLDLLPSVRKLPSAVDVEILGSLYSQTSSHATDSPLTHKPESNWLEAFDAVLLAFKMCDNQVSWN